MKAKITYHSQEYPEGIETVIAKEIFFSTVKDARDWLYKKGYGYCGYGKMGEYFFLANCDAVFSAESEELIAEAYLKTYLNKKEEK